MPGGSSTPLVVAAVILGAAIVVGSVLIRGSIDRGTEALASVRAGLAELEGAVKEAGTRPAPAPAPARAGRLDPSRRYTVETEGAPAVGPKTARIEIVEFSDFQ